MWIKLTLRTGTPTSVDFSRILYITEHRSGGTQLYFPLEVQSGEKRVQKEIVVKEKIDVIHNMLSSSGRRGYRMFRK